MATIASGADLTSVPKNYSELFENYYHYVVRLVGIKGIDAANSEDVASELLLRFMERNSLEKFDPNLKFERAGEARSASFKTYLTAFVESYVRGHRDRQTKLHRREPLVCDMTVDGDDGGGVSWADLNEHRRGKSHPGHEDEILEQILNENLVRAMRSYLADVPRRNSYDKCDLVALFDAVIAQILDKGEINIDELKDQFSVSSTSMHNWCWWLRGLLCEATGRPLPAKRPRRRRVQE